MDTILHWCIFCEICFLSSLLSETLFLA
uniref:Uncharacterized protein n=1 Tax=Rhizophora mucronata TaxID=61149 RepID=A0A2P2PYL7_RHIMU